VRLSPPVCASRLLCAPLAAFQCPHDRLGVCGHLWPREALPVFRLLPVAVIAENPDARCGEVLTPANY
jgi:hypothetical protein